MKNAWITILALITLAAAANAMQVGVVVDDGEGNIQTRCYDADEGDMADFVCQKTGFTCSSHPQYGSSICRIFGQGCPSSDCFCGGWTFWNFHTKTGDGGFSQSPVGISFAEVEENMVLGFRWGNWGDAPDENPDFCDICECPGGRGKRIPKVMGFSIYSAGQKDDSDKPLTDDGVAVINLFDNKTQRPVKGATVEVFDKTPGINPPVKSCTTSRDGTAELELEGGEYKLRISGTKYPQELLDLKVLKATTTTSTSSTTTTTKPPKVTTTTTQYTPPKHISLDSEKEKEKAEKPKIVGSATATKTTLLKEFTPKKEDAGEKPQSLLEWFFESLGL